MESITGNRRCDPSIQASKESVKVIEPVLCSPVCVEGVEAEQARAICSLRLTNYHSHAIGLARHPQGKERLPLWALGIICSLQMSLSVPRSFSAVKVLKFDYFHSFSVKFH